MVQQSVVRRVDSKDSMRVYAGLLVHRAVAFASLLYLAQRLY